MKTSFEALSDSQWELIKEYLPIQRKRKYDLREIINAILMMLRTDVQWRNLDHKISSLAKCSTNGYRPMP